MKSIVIITFLFATLLGGFSTGSYGQNQTTEKDVRERVSVARAHLKSLAFRLDRIIERLEDENKRPILRTEFTAIFSPPDSSHTIIIVSQGRSGHTKTETLVVNKTKYTKVNEGDWMPEALGNYSFSTQEYAVHKNTEDGASQIQRLRH